MKPTCLFPLLCLFALQSVAEPVAIVLHGGSGTIARERLTAELEAAYTSALDRAVSSGYAMLREGVSGTDVVVRTIQLLEDDPLFNAGVGAVMTWEGQHELDASIMHGGSLAAGAVAGVRTVRSPIAAARAVMLHSPHVLLSGPGADEFARLQGLETVDNAFFATERRREDLERYRQRQQAALPEFKFGTVGVVVRDRNGDLVAGTSTGGMTGKRWGRVGDSPIIGAGTFADNASCAVSATGHGEYFIRFGVARDICARVRYLGVPLQEAAEAVVLQVLDAAGGRGGIVALDADGWPVMVFNTPGMYRAGIAPDGRKTIAIYGDGSK